MSNLRIDNIAPSAGGTYRNAPRGIAAAWANFDGTGTPVFRDSLNFSSISDNGTGDYTLQFTSNMASGNYSLTTTGTATYNLFLAAVDQGSILAGSVRVRAYTSAVTPNDSQLMFATIHGDLA